MTEDIWKDKLTPEQYRVLRQAETERAFTSPLNDEKRQGLYKCAACGTVLFDAAHKYNSGSGWPSFFKPADADNIGTSTDYDIGYARTEVHCGNCKSHLGHVFPDGPKPTGQRYCINGVALDFNPSPDTP